MRDRPRSRRFLPKVPRAWSAGRGEMRSHCPLSSEPLEARRLLAADPMISEFLARNDGLLRDGDGRTPDFIEIYNPGSDSIDLEGYRLTDDPREMSKWTFPSVDLDAGDFMVVFASGQERSDYVDAAGHLHTNFSLKRAGEYLALVGSDNTVMSQFGTADQDYPEQLANVSYGVAQSLTLFSADSPAQYLVPGGRLPDWQSPDFDATAAGFLDGTAALGLETSPESRNSFQGEFHTELPQASVGVYSRISFDLAEPTAITNLTLRLKYDDGYAAYLNGVKVSSDNAPDVLSWFSTARNTNRDSNALQWVDIDLSQHVDQLKAGSNVLALHGLNHLNDRGGMLLVAELTAGASDLEAVTGTPAKVGYMTTPTPGAPNVSNAEILSGFVADTKFSLDRGFFHEPQTVEITTETEGAQIFYTTNGTPPTPSNEAAMLYSGPLTISTTTPLRAAAFKDGFLPSNTDTQTYLFLDEVLQQSDQSALDAGFPSQWGPQTPDYEMDQRIIDEYGAEAVKQSLLSVPTVSITVINEDLFGPQGIYTRAESRGAAFERPASIEWLNPDGSEGFQIDAGLRIQGGAFRGYGLTHKNSFRLLFKGEYGDTKLNYPVFGSGDDVAEQFDTLTLRMEANDGWQWSGAGDQPQFARDEFHRRTQRMMGQPAPHGAFIQVYINGIYWGHYNIVERPDASFAESYLGVDKDDWDGFNAAFDRGSVINADGDRDKQDRAVAAWNTMRDMTRDIRSASTEEEKTTIFMALQGKNPDGSDNPNARAQLDVDNYVDYMILNHWGANTDWPRKNFYVGGENSPDSEGFKFFSWDAEWTLTLRNAVSENILRDFAGVGTLRQGLQESEEFRVAWGDRVHKHLFNGGPLYVDPENPNWDPAHPERNVPAATYVQITEEVFDPILAESARWGDQHRAREPYTRDREWQEEKDKLLQNWFPQRSSILLSQYKAANLYPEVDAPVFSEHGGDVASGFALSMTNPGSGTILYTVDGSDPRLVGGAVNSIAVEYAGAAIELNSNVTLKARVLRDGEWSALNEASFLVNDFRITEINYNPYSANSVPGVTEPETDRNDFEFIEFTNTSSAPLDVSNYRFVDGIEITFPENTTLSPAERVLVVKNQAAFEARYGAAHRILGEYSGRLSNEGERLRMVDRNEQIVLSFAYDVDQGWPTRANGQGSTLEIIDSRASTASNTNWEASGEYGGSPGSEAAATSPIRFNELLASSENDSDRIELTNDSNQAVDITGWFLSDDAEDPFKFNIPEGTSIAAFGFQTFTQSQMGFGFSSSRGGQLTLIEADASGRPIRFADQVEYGASLPGVSLGPGPDASGAWLQLAQPTFGSANAGPRSGDVVITEIMYNPADPDGGGSQRSRNFKYIELFNTTGSAIDLAGWQLQGSATYDFEPGAVIGPGATALLVPFRSAATSTKTIFQFTYGVPQDTLYFYRYRGSPEEGNSVLTLERPGQEAADDPGFVATLVADRVDFGLKAPWTATEVGQSLQRISSRADGSSVSNWIVTSPTVGTFEETAPRLAGDSNEDGFFDQEDIVAVLQAAKYLTGQPASFGEGDWNEDGLFNQLDLVAALQTGSYLQGPMAVRSSVSGSVISDGGHADLFGRVEERAIDALFALVKF